MCVKDLEAKNSAAAKTASTKRKSVPGGKENDPKTAKVDGKGDITNLEMQCIIIIIYLYPLQARNKKTDREALPVV